jgi:trimeric autotransporter adhesin
MPSYNFRRAAPAGAALAVLLACVIPFDADALQGSQPGTCRIAGHIASGTVPLPGVAIAVKSGQTLRIATSTEADGGYAVNLLPGQYTITAELTGFDRVEQTITVAADGACAQTVNISMSLAARQALPAGGRAAQQAAVVAATATGGARGAPPPAQPGTQRVQVQPQEDAAAQAAAETTPAEEAAATRLLLPPGFSSDAPSDAIALNGNAASLDRGMMNDRFDAIGRGMFDPATGEFNNTFGGAGFGDGQGPGGRGGPGGPGGRGQQGRGGPGGPGGRGGPGAAGGGRGGDGGGFFLGGRGGQQNRYSGTTNYTFGGSVLDARPFQLQEGQTVKPYTRNSYGATVGGPVKIPGVYDGTRKTNFVLTYNGTHNNNLFDQYATVPTAAERIGDFSAAGVALIDPASGLPFANNQIPAAQISQAAQTLLRFIPAPNLDGSTLNFHNVANYGTASDAINLRVTQNFTPAVAGGGGRGGGRGGGGFGGGRGGGRNANATGTSVNMTAQLQYRRSDGDSINVVPGLGGHTSSRSLAVPISFNIRHKRTMHAINVNFSATSSNATNHFSGIEDVASEAGIYTGISNPFDFGVPSLSFSNFQGLRDLTPSRRTDRRLTLSYAWTQPWKTHLLRAGGDFRLDRTSSQTDASPNGSFVFSGLYTAGGFQPPRGLGLDFADFLLGLPQSVTQQYGPANVRLRGKSGSLFFQDDWRFNSKLTFNLGVRYELIYPFTEVNGQLVDLDVNPTFTAVAPVQAGGTGPFTGVFPKGILRPDINNVGPRLAVAYRVQPGLVVRGGYSIAYNSGSYSTIARQLAAQPPFAFSDTVTAGPGAPPLVIANVLSPVTNINILQNNFGVDPNYQLGRVQTWNADVQKDLTQSWLVGGGYTRTTGASLDIVRAPNRTPTGLKIPTIQAFTYQTSQGISVLNAGSVRLQRRMVKGIGGSVTYTLAKSMDDASNTGGGGTTVAQNDQDLLAEYSLSSFDRRHQVNGNLSFELPFGPNKPWLHGGGVWAAILGGWRGAASYTFQTGTPLTPIVLGGIADIARGSNGSLRADVVPGVPLFASGLAFPYFFNPAAFTAPQPGQFGNAGRNSITGPGNSVLNAQVSRDIRMTTNRAFTLQANFSNILNTENFAAINVNVNTTQFGQVTRFGAARSAQLNLRFRF